MRLISAKGQADLAGERSGTDELQYGQDRVFFNTGRV